MSEERSNLFLTNGTRIAVLASNSVQKAVKEQATPIISYDELTRITSSGKTFNEWYTLKLAPYADPKTQIIDIIASGSIYIKSPHFLVNAAPLGSQGVAQLVVRHSPWHYFNKYMLTDFSINNLEASKNLESFENCVIDIINKIFLKICTNQSKIYALQKYRQFCQGQITTEVSDKDLLDSMYFEFSGDFCLSEKNDMFGAHPFFKFISREVKS